MQPAIMQPTQQTTTYTIYARPSSLNAIKVFVMMEECEHVQCNLVHASECTFGPSLCAQSLRMLLLLLLLLLLKP